MTQTQIKKTKNRPFLGNYNRENFQNKYILEIYDRPYNEQYSKLLNKIEFHSLTDISKYLNHPNDDICFRIFNDFYIRPGVVYRKKSYPHRCMKIYIK